jgi:hypothetical protein
VRPTRLQKSHDGMTANEIADPHIRDNEDGARFGMI